MNITYGIHESPFGFCVIGLEGKAIATITFMDTSSEKKAKELLKRDWPKATFTRDDTKTAPFAKKMFKKGTAANFDFVSEGTVFQKKVWHALTKIPVGTTSTYTKIAKEIKAPKAVRAVGTACGKNKIAFLIPCHRVLTSSGKLGGYATGTKRKEAMLAWESA